MYDDQSAEFAWFRQRLPELMFSHRGQHALLHDCEIVAYFQSSLDAIKDGIRRFGEGNFSVQPVDDTIADLGFYSHVGSALHA